MRKNFLLLMLMTLLPLAGFAQSAVGQQFNSGNYRYEVTKVMVGTTPGEVTMINRREGRAESAFVDADGKLDFPESITVTYEDEVYNFNVAAILAPAMQNHATATSVEIPARLKEIPANCFNGCSNLTSITFQTGSQITTIGVGAFATTRIANFDFSPCTKLLELPNGVFAEAGNLTNSYITTITLPGGTQFKHINGALQYLTELTTINNLENSNLQELIAESFKQCAKLKTLSLPASIKYIDKIALKNSAIETLTINVTSLQYLGGGTVNPIDWTYADAAAATNIYDGANTLKSLTLTGNLGGKICTNAFLDCTNIGTNTSDKKFDISGLNFISQGQIQTDAFKGCTNIKSITLGDITDNGMTGQFTIAANAFRNCPIGSVTIGDINTKDAIGAQAFHNVLKTVTIGAIKADDGVFAADAFHFGNNLGNWVVTLGSDTKALNANVVSLGTELIPAGAFDFSSVATKPGGTAWPVINIGKITSKGAIFDGTTPSFAGNKIEKMYFNGTIIQNGLDACPVAAGANLTTVVFQKAIETGGVGAAAFTNVTALVNLTFNGALAELAVANGAFQGSGITTAVVPAYRTVTYNAAAADIYDLTVSPFAQQAFYPAYVADAALNITLNIPNASALLNLIKEGKVYDHVDGYNGTGAATTAAQQATDIIFGVFFPVVITPDYTFKAYRNENAKNVAWARWELGARVDPDVTGTINANSDLVIKRVQSIDGANVKVTLYGTYTDEDNALNASTIYMVPLKVYDGYYHIPGGNHTTLIAKVEKAGGAEFTDAAKDVKVRVFDGISGVNPGTGANAWPAYAASSIWPGLVNTELFVASNVITNQQLIDKHANDAISPAGGLEAWGYYHNPVADIDIYRGTYGTANQAIKEDLYIMSNPAKYQGFRIDKTPITKENGAYIYTGWYYMLLKHYEGDAAAAPRVVWLDADPDTDPNTTGIFEMKQSLKSDSKYNNAMYNLQGVRVNGAQKGIYILNGKKYVVK